MSPKTKEQFEEIRQRSMEAIKQNALELFGRKGYFNTSISDIAKAAGVSKGLMYNYFESKDALLAAIIQEAIEVGERLIEDAMRPEWSAYEQLEQMTKNSINLIKSNSHYWKLMISLAFQPDALKTLEPVLKRKEQETMSKTVAIFEGLRLDDPFKELMFYGAIMDGIVIQYVQIGEEYPLDDMVEMVLRRYKKAKYRTKN